MNVCTWQTIAYISHRRILTEIAYIASLYDDRDAYQKVNALCLNPNTSDLQWMQLVENTNWPSMIRLILSAAWQTAFHVHYNRFPVLVHCSVSNLFSFSLMALL